MKYPALLATVSILMVAHGATRDSFDGSWKFARFGAMPDGSIPPEPIADAEGRLVPRSMNVLKFKVDGNAEIAGICNGDAISLAPMQGDSLPAFNGLCQVILRGKPGKPGNATLSIESEGLAAGMVSIATR